MRATLVPNRDVYFARCYLGAAWFAAGGGKRRTARKAAGAQKDCGYLPHRFGAWSVNRYGTSLLGQMRCYLHAARRPYGHPRLLANCARTAVLAVRPSAAAAWPPVCRLCLEWRMRLPGQERTGTPANDVEDYRLVVD